MGGNSHNVIVTMGQRQWVKKYQSRASILKWSVLLEKMEKCYRNLVSGKVPQRKCSEKYQKMCSSQRNNKNGSIMTEKEQSGVFNSKC